MHFRREVLICVQLPRWLSAHLWYRNNSLCLCWFYFISQRGLRLGLVVNKCVFAWLTEKMLSVLFANLVLGFAPILERASNMWGWWLQGIFCAIWNFVCFNLQDALSKNLLTAAFTAKLSIFQENVVFGIEITSWQQKITKYDLFWPEYDGHLICRKCFEFELCCLGRDWIILKIHKIKIVARIWDSTETTFKILSASIAVQVCSDKLKNNLMVTDIFVFFWHYLLWGKSPTAPPFY
jgi:hypothetical protein